MSKIGNILIFGFVLILLTGCGMFKDPIVSPRDVANLCNMQSIKSYKSYTPEQSLEFKCTERKDD